MLAAPDLLDEQLTAAEDAARDADMQTIAGVPGAATRAERAHAQVRALAAQIKRRSITRAEARAVLVAQWEALFAKLVEIDRKIAELLEDGNADAE